jgi:hypothetical protein
MIHATGEESGQSFGHDSGIKPGILEKVIVGHLVECRLNIGADGGKPLLDGLLPVGIPRPVDFLVADPMHQQILLLRHDSPSFCVLLTFQRPSIKIPPEGAVNCQI